MFLASVLSPSSFEHKLSEVTLANETQTPISHSFTITLIEVENRQQMVLTLTALKDVFSIVTI